MPRYYVSGLYDWDMCVSTKKPLRANNPRAAEEKFFGKMGRKIKRSDYAERVVLWRDRNNYSAKNLIVTLPDRVQERMDDYYREVTM